MNSDPREAYLGQQEHINEVQSLGLSLGLEEVINTLIREGAAPLLDDGICEVVHQATGLAEALSIRGQVVQEIPVQEELIMPFCHEGTELQDGGNIFTGLPTGRGQEERQHLSSPEDQKAPLTRSQELPPITKLSI